MPVNANILANIRPFSLSDTVKDAETTKYMRVRNELLGYQADEEKAIAARREKRREIEKLYAGMPARIAEYERLGMYEEAAQTKQALLAGKRQGVSMFEIVSKTLDSLPEGERGGAWRRMRQQGLEAGMFEPEDMPDEFDQGWINSWLSKVTGELEELETTYGETDPETGDPTGRTLTQERWQSGGKIVAEFEPYEAGADRNARTGKGGTGADKPWQFSSSDSNAIRQQAVLQFDAILDDQGQFIGIRGEGDRAAAQLIERAEQLMIDAGGPMQMSHGQAVAQAGREQGLKIKSTADELVDDPLAIR